jgi:chromosome partitioning protein
VQRIVILNPKGGSGKTTLAVNIAGYYAQRGEQPVLMDYDPQASTTRWVRRRPTTQQQIRLITAYERDNRVTRAFQLRLPNDTSRVIIDTPAAIDARDMAELARAADKILVPVMPSDIDIHACARCVSNLLLVAKVKREDNRLGIVANRVKRNAASYASLTRFLGTLEIPLVATIRDSQNYTRSAELSLSLHEMKSYQVADDLPQLQQLIDWLEQPARQIPHLPLPGPLTINSSTAATAAGVL